MRTEVRMLCVAVFIALCVEALFATGYRGTFLLTHSYPLSWMAAATALLCAGFGYVFREQLLGLIGRLFPERRTGSRGWFLSWLALGLVLRTGWVLLFPAPLKSDGFAYYASALQMAAHSYTGVYWPPGLPLVLAPFMMVLGVHPWVTVLVCLLLFCGTYAVTWLLARDLAGPRAAGIAAAVLAIWPGYATIGGTNSKEALLALVLLSAMLLYGRAVRGARVRWSLLVVSGLLAGYAALTQPGCLLFFAVIAAVEMLRHSSIMATVARTAAFGLSMLLVILPWAYRNDRVLHRPVLITVNGGTAFYLANNPNANGTYEDEGAMRLPGDLFEADKVGYREGKRWIMEHPAAFLVLAVRKQIVFLGDDGTGVYETLKRDREPSRALYGGLKAITSAFWLLFWVVLLAGARRLFRLELWPWYGLCFLPIVYQWAIDSAFISASHHHMSYVGFFAVLVAMVVTSRETNAQPKTTASVFDGHPQPTR